MRQVYSFERRLQDLETHTDNMFRVAQVVDTKFDSDQQRWFVKIADSPDGQGQGQSTSSVDQDPNFKSDWLPWSQFAHGTIKVSMPPRNKMRVAHKSPYGRPEMAYVEPYHNFDGAKSPGSNPDEVVMTIEDPTDEDSQQSGGGSGSSGSGQQASSSGQSSQQKQKFTVTYNKAGVTFSNGQSTIKMIGDTVEIDCAHFIVNAKTDVFVKAPEQELHAKQIYLGQKKDAIPVKRVDDQPAQPVLAALEPPRDF